MPYKCRHVQGRSSRRRLVMRESEYAFLRLRAARERFKENRYEARRPELWAEVEYWEWRYSRRDR